MDVLSDVLEAVRLTGSVFFIANFYDPWSILSPSHEELLQNMSSDAECISFFHIITEGQCQFRIDSGKPFLLEQGSVVIFPHSCPHIMGSSMEIQPTPAVGLNVFEKVNGFTNLEYGGTGDKTQFICGYLLCDQRFNPLLGAIPQLIILTPDKEKLLMNNPELASVILPVDSNSWLGMTLLYLAEVVRRKNEGSSTIITRLTELMYVEVLRRYMDKLPEESRGWLAGVRDPEIGRALKYLHAHPEEKWNVEHLASEVGVSRSAFAKRFTHLIGQPPMQYLTGWRMQLAKRLLLKPNHTIAVIAEKVGYDSDIAFNRAFKRNVGEPPAHWREHSRIIHAG